MDIQVLESTNNPETLVCRAGRGDYYDGYVGDADYRDIMEPISYDEPVLDGLPQLRWPDSQTARSMMQAEIEADELSNETILEAKTRSFIETQLSRGHFGLWEHPQITFAVKGVSRALMAQITRHRHLTFDVQSQRYVDFSDAEAIVPKSLQDPEHFSRETGNVELSDEDRETLQQMYDVNTDKLFEMYENMVEAGVPKEDARFILPIGTPVNLTVSGNARSFMHVLNLRQKANAQWEIRELSELIADELEEWMPYTGQWWRDNGPMKISP